MNQLKAAPIIMTAVKVKLMPMDVSIFLVTPKKMQRPRYREKTKLLMRAEAMNIVRTFSNICSSG
jgi:hypothetical protein